MVFSPVYLEKKWRVTMKVIVMGCGRMGERVARMLAGDHHDLAVIDADANLLDHLGAEFPGRKVQGIGFDRNVLVQAGIENADAFAATSPSDNMNVVASRIAREIFHVPRVVARLYDPRRAEIYHRLGLVTMSMIDWGAERIVELITHTDLDPLLAMGQGEVILTKIELPAHLAGRSVRDLQVPGEIGVVSIVRDGAALLPGLGSEFCAGDVVYLAIHAGAVDRLADMLGM
jgi:trk system potassium uptake protein